MKFEITLDTLEEMAHCIVDNDLSRDEAAEYAKAVLFEANQVEDSADESLNVNCPGCDVELTIENASG